MISKIFEQLHTEVKQFEQELDAYLSKGASNASQAKRLRKQSTELTKRMKDFRAESVEHHRKV